jgi:uncharacterized delta-60 repeat protein
MNSSTRLPAALLLCLLLAAVVAARPAAARVVVDVGLPAPAGHVDAAGATEAVARPDGGVVLLGTDRGAVVAAALRADGTPDPAFGRGGVARVPVPRGRLALHQALLQPDGRILVVGSTPPRVRYENRRFALLRLLADGRPDSAFGDGGVARPAVQAVCAGCAPAALAPDGAVVLTGATGATSPAIETDPEAPNTFRWVVARLTADGAPDARFGAGGVLPVPGGRAGDGFGFGAVALADGRLVLLGAQDRTPLVARLLADGSPDPGFRAGLPAPVPLQGALRMAVAPDGAVVVLGGGRLARLTPQGERDEGFGLVAVEDAGFAGLVGTREGAVLVHRSPAEGPRPASQPALLVDRVDASGARTSARLALPFGGGQASFARAWERVLPVPALAQNGFVAGALVERPDGSLVVGGGVRVVQPSGEGSGRSTALFAAAALGPGLERLSGYGAPERAARASVRLVRQRARGASALRGVAVRLTASAPGLALVRVRDQRGRVLAEGVQPVFRAGTATVRVQIARAGTRVLRRGGRVRVRVTATFRDVAAGTARARAVRGTLR